MSSFSTLSPQFVGLLNNIAIFPTDRDVFMHEYQSSARYSSCTFLLAFTLVEIPLELLGSLVNSNLRRPGWR